jgi:cytochrome c oxidase cbb3-type subunit 4
MDVTTLRIATTLGAFAMFLAIAGWAYWRGNRARFDEAARIPFEQD